MALIKSTILSAIRGSINGTTFSQNRYGAYARNRTVLANPNTGNQILARGSLATASQDWKTLDAGAQLSWTTYAAGTPVPNRLGDLVHMSGINAFVKTQAFLLFNSRGQQQTAPVTPGLANPIVAITATLLDTRAFTISAMTGGSNAAEAIYGWWISLPLSPGATFYKGPWTYCGSFTGDDRLTEQTTPIFPVEDQLYKVRLRYLDAANKLSIEFISDVIVVTTPP